MGDGLEKILRLHGQKGMPGYEILHSDVPRIGGAANRVYKDHGGGVEGQLAVARAMGVRPAPSRAGLRVANHPDDWKRLGIQQKSYPHLMINDDPDASLVGESTNLKGIKKRYYSAGHHNQQAVAKYQRIVALHLDIPGLDARLEAEAGHDDTAAALLLIRRTGMRKGSTADRGADQQAYGATTALAEHVEISPDGTTAVFTIPSKNAKTLVITTTDVKLVAVLKARKDRVASGERLFDVSEDSANNYLHQATGKGFKVKDLRTYHASTIARSVIESMPAPESKAEFQRARLAVGTAVSGYLGNTPKVALDAYIDPVMLDPWVKDSSWL